MSYIDFLKNPWKETHKAYGSAFFQHSPSPENATGEVVVSSLYRIIGYDGQKENEVNSKGREFMIRTQMPLVHEGFKSELTIPEWQSIIHGVLESPKQASQPSKRFLQMTPVIPDISLYSGSARLGGNPWRPGMLVQRLVLMGSKDKEEAKSIWQSLGEALSVDKDEDVWARWLQHEFGLRREGRPLWALTALDDELDTIGAGTPQIPAVQFCRDLRAILDAKSAMTRHQWISLLESLLRLGTVMHSLWLCDLNHRIWMLVRGVINDTQEPLASAEIASRLLPCSPKLLSYGDPAVQSIRDYSSRYLVARLGLNAVLWSLNDRAMFSADLTSCDGIARFVAEVVKARAHLLKQGVLDDVEKKKDEHTRIIACKKGTGSNLTEYCRYTLGQRQTADEALRGYDQGYFLRKRAEYASAPYVVSMGPVAILAIVHCCLVEGGGSRSIQSLVRHLGSYGIELNREDIASGELGRKLRTLGLVLDSPDAESGMLLVEPFPKARRADAQ